MQEKHIWTIGHSVHPLDTFLEMLRSFSIALLVDIRSFPSSRRLPHFNQEAMQRSLPAGGVRYLHIKDLAGRRKPVAGSENTGWMDSSFRGYADYMQTPAFAEALLLLEKQAAMQRVAYMCSEALWQNCHRSLVSDKLKSEGWSVNHIMGIGISQPHTYTKPARIVEGKLSYRDDTMLF